MGTGNRAAASDMAMKAVLGLALAAGLAAQDREIALGERVASDIRKHTTPGAAEPYVRAIGNRLKPSGTFWQFEVVADDLGGATHEPIAIPGAHLFVPEKLILAAGSEAELAGMLAQAMARVLERTAGPMVVAMRGDFGGTPEQRAAVLRADRRAVGMLAAAGYDPAALLDYVKRVQPEAPSYSRLPALADRVAALEEALKEIPARAEWIETTAAFVAAQEQVLRKLPNRRVRRPTLFGAR